MTQGQLGAMIALSAEREYIMSAVRKVQAALQELIGRWGARSALISKIKEILEQLGIKDIAVNGHKEFDFMALGLLIIKYELCLARNGVEIPVAFIDYRHIVGLPELPQYPVIKMADDVLRLNKAIDDAKQAFMLAEEAYQAAKENVQLARSNLALANPQSQREAVSLPPPLFFAEEFFRR